MHRNLPKLLTAVLVLALAAATVAAVSSEDSDAASTHDVSFRTNGGSGVNTTMTVIDCGTLELPTSLFTRSGYYLTGWGVNSSGSGTVYAPGQSVTVTSDMTLYAQWAQLSGTYDADASGTAAAGSSFSYTADMQGDSPWILILEYLWSEVGTDVGDVEDALVWIEKPDWLSVTGYVRGGSGTAGSTITLGGTPVSPGVYPVTVTSDVSASYDAAATVSFVITVSAASDSTGTVTFDLNGGTGTANTLSGPIGTVVTLPGEGSVSRSGYVLAGWSITVTEGTAVFALGSYFILDGDYVATAYWLPEANVVILDGTGQIGNSIDAFIGYQNEQITLPSSGYTMDGYVFAGWRLSSAPDDIYAPGYIYTIDGPTYMVAYYIRESASYCTVTYDANGGVGSLSQIVESGKNVVLPGREFSNSTNLVGWESSADGQVYEPGDIVEITADTTFSAVWSTETPSVVIVSFDLNGGSGSAAAQVLDYGGYVTVPSTPTRSAHVFLGWYVVGGGEFDFSQPVRANITLRAEWAEHFTRTYSDGLVVITMSGIYASLPTTVDWGDGTTSSGSLSFTHDYGGESAGTITVTTTLGVTGGTVSSTVRYSVPGSGGDGPGGGSGGGGPEGGGSLGTVLVILAVTGVLLAVAAAYVGRYDVAAVMAVAVLVLVIIWRFS